MRAKPVLITLAALALPLLAGLAWLLMGPGPMAFAGGKPVTLASYSGPNPTGVPAQLAGSSLVERGEYLARAADCEVCHTAIGGKPYAGGFALNLPFGALYSTNITPDRETGIGAYSDAQFLAALRKGVRRDGAHLYPGMPFASYTYMTDDDALAIKAYLFSLAPVHAPARTNTLSFPFNQRPLIGLWAKFFNPDKRFEPNPERSAEWNRGAYLAEAMAHCSECHTPRNLAFALDHRQKFAGAVAGGWRAYNISSARSAGVGGWRDDELVAYLSQGHAEGRGAAAGPMGEVADYSLKHLAASDIRALVTYLRSVPPAGSDKPRPVAMPAPSSPKEGMAGAPNTLGEQVFAGACASCHDWTGVSPLMSYATFTGARAVNDPNATNVAQVVISGVHRLPPHSEFMPAFGDIYSDTEIAAVANYVTARFGAKGSRLTDQDIAKLRRQTAQ